MSGRAVAKVVRKISPADAGVASAWERFASGDEVAEGVRPEVLLSWSRCRDEFRVDPAGDRAPLADPALPFSAEENVVAAELGAAAMAITNDVRSIGGVVAVADGNGRILATWGDESTAAEGSRQNLSPLFSWTEAAAGTSGVGLALESRDPIAITRFEHWCAAFHDWSCAAIAVRDPINERPVGVIDISVWNRPLPPTAVGWLKGAVAGVEERLRQRAVQAYGDLVAAYRQWERFERGLAVLDSSGRIVMADDVARAALGAARGSLGELARSVIGHGRVERGWVGSAELADGARVTVEPVTSADRVVGVLVRAAASGDGEVVPALREPAPLVSDRIVGVRGGRLILVSVQSVRTVEMADGLVWLDTDEGRLRAPGRGLEQLEQRLEGAGFLRVNRQALVNLQRVRELSPGFKGGFFVLMDGSTEAIPVSRRRVPALRASLGF
jgi:hypothetical protein